MYYYNICTFDIIIMWVMGGRDNGRLFMMNHSDFITLIVVVVCMHHDGMHVGHGITVGCACVLDHGSFWFPCEMWVTNSSRSMISTMSVEMNDGRVWWSPVVDRRRSTEWNLNVARVTGAGNTNIASSDRSWVVAAERVNTRLPWRLLYRRGAPFRARRVPEADR